MQASGVVGYEPEEKQRLGLKDEQLLNISMRVFVTVVLIQ